MPASPITSTFNRSNGFEINTVVGISSNTAGEGAFKAAKGRSSTAGSTAPKIAKGSFYA